MKFFFALTATLLIVYSLNRGWDLAGNRIPPLGKFLSPTHGFWQNMEPDSSIQNASLAITGLNDVVTVVYDSLLIPHIFAENDEDLYLAQGFVTAQHRLWQMDIQTRATAGRLSEVLGEKLLNYDREQRRLGLVFAAEHALEAIQENPTTQMLVARYTEGVNQYIQSLSYKDLPLEYKLMDFEPEPWTSLKCALLIRRMAQNLNMGNKDLQMTNALMKFGAESIELLYPDNELQGQDPIVSKPGQWTFNPITLDSVPPALPPEYIGISGLKAPEPGVGSNNWVVSGSKTQSGYPILANDPHLDIYLPSIWYAVHLHTPEVNTMGVSLPGAPMVIIGFNDSIAWGITNAQRDLVDWYKITYETPAKDRYLLDGTYQNTRKQVEEIQVRGKDIFYDTVVYTHWGPIPYDENFRAKEAKSHYAFRWISHDKSNEMITFYQLNHAHNHEAFMKALDHFECPGQNIVFASTQGDIGIRIQGKYPVRKKYEGKFALDGSLSAMGWQQYIPFEQNITDKNPERGFVSSANQYPADPTYPYYITANSYEAYRNRRINRVLSDTSKFSIQDMMALQNDNYDIKAEENLPFLLPFLDSLKLNEQEKHAKQILTLWDYQYAPESEGAVYFDQWWETLMTLLWDEMHLDSTVSLRQPTSYHTSTLLKTHPQLSYYDIQYTKTKETREDLIAMAFKNSVAKIDSFKNLHQTDTLDWGLYKGTQVQHLARLKPLGYTIYHGGTGSTVNASKRSHGPSWRMVVELNPQGIQAYGVYPGGQSGNPGSPYYSNLLEAYRTGDYFPFRFKSSAEAYEKHTLKTLTLTPSMP